jgi:CRISP-associated protein Cas1
MTTLYLTQEDVAIEVTRDYFKASLQNQQVFRTRINNVNQFIIFGNIRLPKEVIKAIYSHQIPTLYLTERYEYVGRLENPSNVRPKYLTQQRKQARNIKFNLATVESMVWAKLHNKHSFLQGWTQYQINYVIERALDYLKLLMDNLSLASSVEELREYSEEADNVYRYAFASLLEFYKPSSRTIKEVTGLLNLGTQLLHQYIYTILNTVELHPDYGMLHSSTHHELPLAWDFTSEFQAPIVEDLVLNFVRNLANSNGNGKKRPLTLLQNFLQHWEAKLRTFVLHPYAGEVSYRQCIDLQVREYLACLLGDIEFYRPLALKLYPNHSLFTNIIEPQKAALTLVKQ